MSSTSRGLKVALLSVVFVLYGGLVACTPRYEGDYRGRVIDADTGEPIEGVVVFGAWNREYATPAGGVHTFYEARETMTDRNGEFVLPGPGLVSGPPGLTFIELTAVTVFKAGYEHIGEGPWRSLKRDPILRKKVRWEGDKAVVFLKKWTIEERRKRRFWPYPAGDVPKEKYELLLREIEKERREIGR